MKKRLLATVLAVAMMGTLAACGNGTKTDSAGNDANSSKTEQVSSEAGQTEPMIRCSVCWMQVCFP